MTSLGTTDYSTPATFGLEDRWIETGPGEITHYHETGSGTPVVLLHGSGTGVSAAANWSKTLPALGDTSRVIAPDLIGWGATIQPEETEFGIREWGQHTLRLLDALGLKDAWLIGNSLGGWIALQLAIDHPERVLGVVTMGTGGVLTPSAAIQKHLDPDITADGMKKAFLNFVVDHNLVTDELVAARQEVAKYEVETGRLHRVMTARERDRREVALDPKRLATLTVPVLLIHGLNDRIIPPARTWELVAQMPTADAVMLNASGHWTQLERSEAFNNAVKSFIRGGWSQR